MSVDKYKREHVRWMERRADGLTYEEESVCAEKLDAVWRTLSKDERAHVEAWLKEQDEYRKAHGMPSTEKGIDELTPGERAAVEYEGEYELILGENEEAVLFQIHGREVEISRGMLLDCDDKGRFWLERGDAEKLGLLH